MTENEDDIFQQAEDIMRAASERNKRLIPLSPPDGARDYFLGAAFAGRVLIHKKMVEEHGAQQIHLEYLTDPADGGDFDDILHLINAEGFTVTDPNPVTGSSEPQLGGFSTNRIFFIHSGKLYASNSQGMIPVGEQHGISVETPVIVTADEPLALSLFQSIEQLPDHSRGRDLYAIFNSAFQAEPSKFMFKSANIPWLLLNSDPADMDYLAQRLWGDKKVLTLWYNHFKGKVPEHWGQWAYIQHDLEENDNLPPEWLDAAVTHFHPLVVEAACQHHRLSEEQFAIALLQIGGNRFTMSDIISAQMSKGMGAEEVERAIALARNEGRQLIIKKLQ